MVTMNKPDMRQKQSMLRRFLIALGLLTWTAASFLLGSLSPQAGIAISEAAETTALIRLDKTRLAGDALGEYAPYEPDAGDLVARGNDFYYSPDALFGIGVWESRPGSMTYKDLAYDELMFVLEGSIVMTDQRGNVESFGPGEGLVLPRGWSGTLAVTGGGVRKLWVSYEGNKK